MAMSVQYQYTRLLEPDAFRLITLHPSTHIASPLVLDVFNATLNQYDDDIVDHYIALSYVWGDQRDTRTIQTGGKHLEITVSLEAALRHIRDTSRTMQVWADGICINQTDTEEKNVQVRQMGRIYGLARSTIIYLGESTLECDLVLDALSSIVVDSGPGVSKLLANVLHPSAPKPKKRSGSHSRPGEAGPKRVDKRILALAEEHILQRPWFTRIWVLQELVLSLDPWVQICSRRIRWNIFSHLLAAGGTKPSVDLGFKRLSAMDDARIAFASTRLLPYQDGDLDFIYSTQLLKALIARRGAGVTDPRDMILGILGVLGNGFPPPTFDALIKNAYETSVCDLYADVAQYIIQSKGFNLLSCKEDIALQNRRSGLASWAPDWTVPHVTPSVDTLDVLQASLLDSTHVLMQSSVRSSVPPILACVGFIGTTIDIIIDDIPPSFDPASIPNQSGRDHICLTAYEKYYDAAISQCYGPNDAEEGLVEFVKRYARKLGGFGSLPLPKQLLRHPGRRNDPKASLVPWLVARLLDPRGPGPFPGKRVAILSNSTFALVPESAHPGDVIGLIGRLSDSLPYIMRELPSDESVPTTSEMGSDGFSYSAADAEILKFFNDPETKMNIENTMSRAGWSTAKTSTRFCVRHFNFVGECLIERAITPSWDGTILALH